MVKTENKYNSNTLEYHQKYHNSEQNNIIKKKTVTKILIIILRPTHLIKKGRHKTRKVPVKHNNSVDHS